MAAPSPLLGTRVIDFSKVLAGPLCTQYLADLGAEVIKIEPVDGGDDTRNWPPFEDGIGTIFLAVNRNKRSVSIDLKTDAGRAICHQLITTADIVIESFGPGVAQRVGIDYETCHALKPDLIYCSISGYGPRGPKQSEKGYDLIAQAFTGMLSVTGEPDGPPVRSPFSPVDQGTGMNAAIAILAALLQRRQTGAGMRIDASLFDTAVGFLGYFLQGFWQRGTEPVRPGSGHESLCPYGAFETADRPLILGVANDTLWRRFCALAQRPELADDPLFLTGADRVANRKDCESIVRTIMRSRNREHWMEALQAHGIPCAPVQTLGELSNHPHSAASGMIFEYETATGRPLKGVAPPYLLDGQRPDLRRPPPAHGADTISTLRQLGLDSAAIEALARAGAIRAA